MDGGLIGRDAVPERRQHAEPGVRDLGLQVLRHPNSNQRWSRSTRRRAVNNAALKAMSQSARLLARLRGASSSALHRTARTSLRLRPKIDVLVDGPLVCRVVALAEVAGVSGYILLPALGDAGCGGRWSDDQITGAQAKAVFVTVMTDEKAIALADALAPLLNSHGLLSMTSAVDVVRGGKF
jgi:hypothetical protein